MVNKTEKLNVDLELQLETVKKANQAFENMNQKTKQMEQNMLQVKKTFDSIIKQNTTFQKTFSQQPARVAKITSRGSPTVQLLNAEEKRIKANEKAFIASEKQKLRAVKQRVNQTDSLEQAKAKLRAQRERITTIQVNGGRLANGRFASLRKEEQAYNQIKTSVDRLSAAELKRTRVLKRTQSIQNSIQTGQARNRSQELLQVGRDHAVARTTGDGGASLFKIQAQLLGNYLIMNKIFQLFSFGTQFVLELDQAFTQLQAITATTATEMEGMKRELIAVSEQTKFTAVEVAQAATVLGQAGFSTTQIKESIQDVTFLATAVGTDLKSAVDVTTSTLSIFNLRAEETEHVANVLTGAINNSKLTLDKLSLGLQFAGNTAAQAGATFEETVSVLGAMANAGIRSGSTLGTGLRQVLVSFLKPSKKMQQQLESVGLTMEDVNVESNGLINVFETLTAAGFGASNAFQGMQVRAAAAFLAVSNNIDVARELETALLLTNAAAEANAVQMKSLANSLDLFKSILGVFITRLSEPFKDFLITATQALGGLLTALNSLGAILPVIGSALIAVGGALFLKRLQLMTRNLFKFSVATRTASRATGILNREVTKSTVVFRNLTKTLKANAPFLVFTALIAAADHFGVFTSKAEKASIILDKLKAAVDETKGSIEGTDGRIQSVTERIEKLTKRSALLKNNSHELNLEVLKAQNEFGKYGLVIDKTKAPLEGLTDALRDLREEFLKMRGLDLQKLGLDQSRLIQQQASNASEQAANFLGTNPISRLDSTLKFANLSPEANAAIQGSTTVSQQFSQIGNLNSAQLSDAGEVKKSIASLSDVRVQLNAFYKTLSDERETIERALKAGTLLPNGRGSSKVELKAIVEAVDQVGSLLGRVDGIQGELFTRGTQISEQTLNSFNLSTSVKTIDEYITGVIEDTAAIRQSLKGVSDPQERQQQVDTLSRHIDDVSKLQEDFLESFIDPDEMTKIVGDDWEDSITTLLANKTAELNKAVSDRGGVVEGVEKQAIEAEEGIANITEKILRNRLKLLKQQASGAKDKGAIKNINAQATEVIQELLTLKLVQFRKQLDNPDATDQEKELIASEMKLATDQASQEIKSLGDTVTNFRDKFIDVEKALSKQADELGKLKQVSDQATRNIDLRIKTLRSTVSANGIGGPLEGKYSNTQIRDIEERADNLEFERLQIQQEALETRLEATKAIVDQRKAEVAKIRNGPRQVTGEAAKRATEAGKKLAEAEKAQIEVKKELSTVNAELRGKLDETSEATHSLTEEIQLSIAQWNRDSATIDIGDTVKSQMDNASTAFGRFISDVSSGTATAKDAFRSMATSIIKSLADIAAQQAAKGIFGAILSTVAGAGLSTTSTPSVDSSGFITTSGGGVTNFNTGGHIKGLKRAAVGTANSNRDSVPILARPGEYILRNSAVNMIGRDNLDQINAMGNKTISKGVSNISSREAQGGGGIMNVYVVSPDQKPQMTAQDVVVTITEDMAKGGPTKKLVKSIQMGKV